MSVEPVQSHSLRIAMASALVQKVANGFAAEHDLSSDWLA
jgi:hypothetical protein